MTLVLKLAGRPEPLPQYFPSLPPGKLSHGLPCCVGSGPPGQSLLIIKLSSENKTRIYVSEEGKNCETVDVAGRNGLHLGCPSLNHGETA